MEQNWVHRAVGIRLGSAFLSFLCFLQVSTLNGGQEFKNLSRDFELEILKLMSKGNIPSAAVALVYRDRIVLTGAYGYSNTWARTPAFAETVYLIGSTFKTRSTFALLQQMEQGKSTAPGVSSRRTTKSPCRRG